MPGRLAGPGPTQVEPCISVVNDRIGSGYSFRAKSPQVVRPVDVHELRVGDLAVPVLSHFVTPVDKRRETQVVQLAQRQTKASVGARGHQIVVVAGETDWLSPLTEIA